MFFNFLLQSSHIERCQSLESDNLKVNQQSELQLSALHENLQTLRTELTTAQKQSSEAQKIADNASELKLGRKLLFINIDM